MHFLDVFSGSPIETCTSFVVFDGEQKFAHGYRRCNKVSSQRSLLR